MKLYRNKNPYDECETYRGRSGGYDVEIAECYESQMFDKAKKWFFFIKKESQKFTYNSLWDKLKYDTKEQCVEAALNKIKDLKNQKEKL